MCKIRQWAVIVGLVLLQLLCAAEAMIADGLVELVCVSDWQCEHFKTGRIEAACLDGNCRCHYKETKELTDCLPTNMKTNNIIGGGCPCNLPNATCQISEDLCHCRADHIPTKDKRRCVPEKVALGGFCETDEQCQAMALFSHCDGGTKTCACLTDFYANGTNCAARAGDGQMCESDKNCSTFGPHAYCLKGYDMCVCAFGYVSAERTADCLPGRMHGESCVEALQCHLEMGPGASCKTGACHCADGYMAVKEKSKNGMPAKTVCEPVVQIGQYCSSHEHCRNGNRNGDEQLMKCERGECVCRFGVKNQVPCSADGAESLIIYKIGVLLMLASAPLRA